MFPDVDTRDATAVAARIREISAALFPGTSPEFFDRVFALVQDMFTGNFPGFAPIDMDYHDYQHTLQATLCMADIMAGYHRHGEGIKLTHRHFELGLAAALLHDCGYLKTPADGGGTGAKFTYTHVLRSCAVGASQLPALGANLAELRTVIGAIRCTGPDADITKIYFEGEIEQLLGACVATADYLGQLAAADYPQELEILFREFSESDDYIHVPMADRLFKSPEDLISKTPGFWQHVVLPKLNHEFYGVYRFLAEPYPDGPNRYLEAIERNIKTISGLPTSPPASAAPPASSG
ncbi:hypothetical protein [Synoicihabitans lomoniglobus]|uniref:HD/PDEase domain-containing protein n=1 Tax=Synoicihabitans lomoniglobus TaxID=2909285 RepID=A0AAF0CSE3_9BACT|nr:hypothetical protein [Opitutaceae bacterium LMO-M01]WED67205.1 hypothetical protein PXH66_10110 [Opitutaceae bacterium LMO-M01]